MASRFRHEDVSAVPAGWKVRTVSHGTHRVRVAFPPGRRHTGSGRLVSILHPLKGNNPCNGSACSMRSSNPAELLVLGANPPRRAGFWKYFSAREKQFLSQTLHMPAPKSMEEVQAYKQQLRRIDEVNAKYRNPRVETYQMYAAVTGRPIRKATKVIFEDGREVKFIDRIPKKKAIREALEYLGRGNNSNPSELLILGANPEGERDAREKEKIERERKVFKCPHCERKFSAAEVEARDFTKHMAAHRAERFGQSYGQNPRVEVVHSENPPVEEIVEEFTGQDAEWIDIYNEPHMSRGRYAQLGALLSIHVKPAKGGQVQKISFSEEDRPVVVTDSSARQIYFVGGNQDISSALESFGAEDRGNGVFELGEARRIDYECRKEHVAHPDEDRWKHDHGEEDGRRPTVLFDSRNKRLLYEGGNYRIEGAWIHN